MQFQWHCKGTNFFKIDKKKRRIICIYAIFVVPLQRILKYSNKIY